MTIIATAHLIRELPLDATNENGAIDDAVEQASSFVQNHAIRYEYFDDYQESPVDILAPGEVGRVCLEVAKAFYYLRIAQVNRNGDDLLFWQSIIDNYKSELKTIIIEPTWETQTISLDSNKAMRIGTLDNGGTWPHVIPFKSEVISATTNTWVYHEDFEIEKGGRYTDENPNAWYLYADTSSLEGTLRYLRTWRKDGFDYARHVGSV